MKRRSFIGAVGAALAFVWAGIRLGPAIGGRRGGEAPLREAMHWREIGLEAGRPADGEEGEDG